MKTMLFLKSRKGLWMKPFQKNENQIKLKTLYDEKPKSNSAFYNSWPMMGLFIYKTTANP